MAERKAICRIRLRVAWFSKDRYTVFMRRPTWKDVWWALAWIMVGMFLGSVLVSTFRHDVLPAKQVREKGNFTFINPLLECEISEGVIDATKQNFKNELSEEVERVTADAGIDEIAVYYRDLNNGPAFGIREQERFFPASLLKVPVMMAYFDASEDNPGLLDKSLQLTHAYEAPQSGIQLIPPGEEIVPGKAYTVRELLRRSIQYSDNQAVTLLIEHIEPRYIRNLYRTLGVSDEVLNGPDGKLTVREYASFFRVLFNASYLDKKNSEEALRILAGAVYDRGLVAGVPAGTIVAHKFGEAGAVGNHQIHDCGIIYHPRLPYLLCVMTRGDHIPKLEKAIADISRFVWQRVSEFSGE